MKFKPEDFCYNGSNYDLIKDFTEQANTLLQAHLATLPKVYGHPVDISSNSSDHTWTTIPTTQKAPTHAALLWGITEIEKKECEHVPKRFDHYECVHCGVKLKASWSKA